MDGTFAYPDPDKPVFIIVEAKRSEMRPDASSEAELIGQLKYQLIKR